MSYILCLRCALASELTLPAANVPVRQQTIVCVETKYRQKPFSQKYL